MALETVTITIVDDQVVPERVDGISVRVFGEAGALITEGLSGVLEPGEIALELPGSTDGTVYELRFFKVGTALAPVRIAVYSPPSLASTGTNRFRCVAEVFRLLPAQDPRLCRVSGFVANAARRSRRGVNLVVLPQFNAFIYDASVVTPGRFIVRTDGDGFCSFELFRFAIYEITIEGQEETRRTVQVPDRAALSLTALLFPVVASVTFAEAANLDGSYTVTANAAPLQLTPTIVATDYRVLDGVGAEDVGYGTDAPAIASVYVLGDRIEIRGHAAGTTALRITRLDESVVSLPDPGIVGGTVVIHVV
jgi:hypothetical protein